jgi:cell division protein FtsL
LAVPLPKEEFAPAAPVSPPSPAPRVGRPEADPGTGPGRRRAAGRSQARTFARVVWLTALPVLCLVIYVGMWTSVMRRGYYRNQLAAKIRALSVENDSLQAEVRRLQSPARIFPEATRMKMERPADIKFVQAPASRRVAAR